MKYDSNCPLCGNRMQHVMERALRKMPPAERMHAHGNVWLERRPVGVEIVGECLRCGLQRKVPFGLPVEVRLG